MPITTTQNLKHSTRSNTSVLNLILGHTRSTKYQGPNCVYVSCDVMIPSNERKLID